MEFVKIQIAVQREPGVALREGVGRVPRGHIFSQLPGDHTLSSKGVACQLRDSKDSPWFIAVLQASQQC